MANTRKYLKRSNSKFRKMRGGSPASDRVMEILNDDVATRDYVVSPRIRTKSPFGNTNTYKLSGGAHCNSAPKATSQSGGAHCNSAPKVTSQSGGAHCNSAPKATSQSGGRRSNSKRNKAKRSKAKRSKAKRSNVRRSNSKRSNAKRSNVRRSNKKQRGGYGSDWISSQYSLSLSPQTHRRSCQFSRTRGPTRDELLNPPNRGLAGSGN